jgi:hypothetical protein
MCSLGSLVARILSKKRNFSECSAKRIFSTLHSALSTFPAPSPCKMPKNRRVSALQIPYYHVIMGPQIISVKCFSTPTHFSCRPANFPAAYSRATAQRRKCQFPKNAPRRSLGDRKAQTKLSQF